MNAKRRAKDASDQIIRRRANDTRRLERAPVDHCDFTKGYRFGGDSLSAAKCSEVVAFLEERLRSLNRQLDLRLVILGFRDRMLAEKNTLQNTWKDLLDSRVKETPNLYEPRIVKLAREQKIAIEIHEKKLPQAEAVKEWQARTGKSKASFYNALKRVAA